MEALKLICDNFADGNFYIKVFGNSIVESELGADVDHYLLFHIVQGAHHSLITLKRFLYPEV